ncbi:MAG: hypothetical protein RL708_1681 [Bacteroidota bacterium]|jgi:hypothetical protein
MKKIILVIAVLSSTTFYSCYKCTYYFASCNKGHALWKGKEWETCHGERAESMRLYAHYDANDHDHAVHNSVQTAIVSIR